MFVRARHAGQLWLNLAYIFSDFRFDNDADLRRQLLPGAPRHLLRGELLYSIRAGVYFRAHRRMGTG